MKGKQKSESANGFYPERVLVHFCFLSQFKFNTFI
jgi:hypothetical protein